MQETGNVNYTCLTYQNLTYLKPIISSSSKSFQAGIKFISPQQNLFHFIFLNKTSEKRNYLMTLLSISVKHKIQNSELGIKISLLWCYIWFFNGGRIYCHFSFFAQKFLVNFSHCLFHSLFNNKVGNQPLSNNISNFDEKLILF